jgi:hypothetical protein
MAALRVGELCECCSREVPPEELELRWVAVKKRFMKIGKCCRDRYVTFTPQEWEPNSSDIAIPQTTAEQ